MGNNTKIEINGKTYTNVIDVRTIEYDVVIVYLSYESNRIVECRDIIDMRIKK